MSTPKPTKIDTKPNTRNMPLKYAVIKKDQHKAGVCIEKWEAALLLESYGTLTKALHAMAADLAAKKIAIS